MLSSIPKRTRSRSSQSNDKSRIRHDVNSTESGSDRIYINGLTKVDPVATALGTVVVLLLFGTVLVLHKPDAVPIRIAHIHLTVAPGLIGWF
jgi:hypothetical protein